jgi:hypothetical protein
MGNIRRIGKTDEPNALAGAVSAAGRVAVASARAATSACLDADAAVAVAGTAFLFATQASILYFCRSHLRVLAGLLLPCACRGEGLVQEKSTRLLLPHVSKTSLTPAPVVTKSRYSSLRHTAARPKAGSGGAGAAPM